MRLSRFRPAASVCLWSAYAAAGLTALPVSAQPTAPAPPVSAPNAAPAALALSPLQGAASAEAASEKAFQNQVDALLKRYSLTGKTLKMSGKSDDLPPALMTRGHQFLTDAFALSNAYEKSHASGKSRASGKNPTLGSQISGSDLPASSQCTFKVLSPTHVQIMPRTRPKSAFEARLEDGQWRIDVGGLTDYSAGNSAASKPKMTVITPQAAALLKAIEDNNIAVVGQMLKAIPALANTPPAYYKAGSYEASQLPLSEAALSGNSLQVVTLLLHSGAKVNAEDDTFKSTALDQAVQHNTKAVVLLLLAHGANIAHKDLFGETALHLAVSNFGNAGVVSVLLAHGADVDARDGLGKTPLAIELDPSDHGMDHAAIVKLLRQHGAK